MARGRRDYTWGVLQDAILPGRYSVNWFKGAVSVLEGDSTSSLLSYTVPVGYKFFLTGVFVTCSSPQIQQIAIYKGVTAVIASYFALNYHADFASLGSYNYEAGEIFKVGLSNFDTVDATFWVEAFGVLELLV